MGNRAVITTESNFCGLSGIGIYVYWNGGRDSIQAFLKYCELHGYRAPSEDNYGWAMLTNVITNFFGDGLSCGVDRVCKLDCDNYDNGVYIIKDWEIVDRKYFKGHEQDTYDLLEMLLAIDNAQPESMQLGKEKIMELITPKEE